MFFPISTEEFVAAYRKTGLKPSRCEWFGKQVDEDGDPIETAPCVACGLGCLIVDRRGRAAIGSILSDVNHDRPFRIAADLLGLTYSQAKSFTAGFDGHYREEDRDWFDPAAFDAGRAAWEAVSKEEDE